MNWTEKQVARAGGKAAPHKFHARTVSIDGHTFDSIAEAGRYYALLFSQQHGFIEMLRLQHRWVLQEAFTDSDGKKHRAIVYVSDFDYWERLNHVVEDVKGCKTPVYQLKKKLFLKRYPDVFFREINNSRKTRTN